MKIIDVQTALITGPCTDDPFLREARKLRSAAFILAPWDCPRGYIRQPFPNPPRYFTGIRIWNTPSRIRIIL